jgi:LacI family transcriptional regulator
MDVVLDQAPEAQARRAIDLILARLGLHDLPIDNPPIRFITFTAENL